MKTFSGWAYQPAETTETGIPTAYTSGPAHEDNRLSVER